MTEKKVSFIDALSKVGFLIEMSDIILVYCSVNVNALDCKFCFIKYRRHHQTPSTKIICSNKDDHF